jgi:hypothetical protein
MSAASADGVDVGEITVVADTTMAHVSQRRIALANENFMSVTLQKRCNVYEMRERRGVTTRT